MDKDFCKICKECGHTKDWHYVGDLFYQMIFGIKMTNCQHYTKDYTLPFWKRKKIYCKCKCYSQTHGKVKA